MWTFLGLFIMFLIYNCLLLLAYKNNWLCHTHQDMCVCWETTSHIEKFCSRAMFLFQEDSNSMSSFVNTLKTLSTWSGFSQTANFSAHILLHSLDFKELFFKIFYRNFNGLSNYIQIRTNFFSGNFLSFVKRTSNRKKERNQKNSN